MTLPQNIGWATPNAISPLAPLEFDRAPVGPEDVRIDIAYCGVCHSDIHQARDEWGGAQATNFPCMPGHEVAGTVTEVGDRVSRYAVGDRVGVGCMVFWGGDHVDREEQYQSTPPVLTYNAADPDTGTITFGGYSDQIVVHEHFVLAIPDALPLELAAPLLCAAVTTWSPLKHWKVGPGSAVGVAGIGGLGHLAIRLAKQRGADRVVALTTTPGKRQAALDLGADEVILMTDPDAIAQAESTLDMVLSTIPTKFDLDPYLTMLRHDGAFVSVGTLEPEDARQVNLLTASSKRLSISGSFIGDIAETQEVLEFCAEHGIAPAIEIIPVERINEVWDQVVAKEARFRYVIDNATVRAAPAGADEG